MNEYSEAHRVLLTFIRGVKCISVEDLTEKFVVLAEHFGIDAADPSKAVRVYIGEINVQIAKAYFKIALVRGQETGIQQYVFINTKFDDIIQGGTPYSAPELETIKHLIDSVVNAHGFAYGVPYVNAKQQVASLLKLKGSELEFFIQRLVDDGWINLTEHNRLVLSSVTLAELAIYLNDRYGVFSTSDTLGKLLKCVVCDDFVTLGKKCRSNECPSSFHAKCLNVFSRDNPVCPNKACSEPVTGVIDVGTSSSAAEQR